MGGTAETCAARMEEILAAYHRATVDLLDALQRSDEEAVSRQVGIRSRCIGDYSAQMDAWLRLPACDRSRSFRKIVRWHHSRIDETEADVDRYIRSLRDETKRRIARVAVARKATRAYRSSGRRTNVILSGRS